MRTIWLSFADADRPTDEQFLGVCVVEVEQEEADAIKLHLLLAFPQHQEGAEWVAAATAKARAAGCNPGGQVLSWIVPDEALPDLATTPRNQLLQKPELAALGHI